MSLIKTKSLCKTFKIRKLTIPAVENLEIQIEQSDFFALVGESGSGKSTVIRLLLKLITPDSGEILFKGKNIWNLEKDDLKTFYKSIGVVFQDPYASLNPRLKVFSIVEEPLRIHEKLSKEEAELKIKKIFSELGLDEDLINRYPHQLSGGQRQRVAIARALILNPDILMADEPLSALDISLQSSILNQLIEIRKKRNLSIFLITHDLNVVRAVSNRIGVMHLGRIVEEASTEEIFKNPLHPYTSLLLRSIPGFHRKSRKKIPKLTTETKNAWFLKGCRFYTRCDKRMPICNENVPQLKNMNGRKVRCFLY